MSKGSYRDENKLSADELQEFIRTNRDTEGAYEAEVLTRACQVETQLSSRGYPINNFEEFIQAIGSDKKIGINNKELRPVDIKNFVPEYYFPIRSTEDFMEKALELGKLHHVLCQFRRKSAK